MSILARNVPLFSYGVPPIPVPDWSLNENLSFDNILCATIFFTLLELLDLKEVCSEDIFEVYSSKGGTKKSDLLDTWE